MRGLRRLYFPRQFLQPRPAAAADLRRYARRRRDFFRPPAGQSRASSFVSPAWPAKRRRRRCQAASGRPDFWICSQNAATPKPAQQRQRQPEIQRQPRRFVGNRGVNHKNDQRVNGQQQTGLARRRLDGIANRGINPGGGHDGQDQHRIQQMKIVAERFFMALAAGARGKAAEWRAPNRPNTDQFRPNQVNSKIAVNRKTPSAVATIFSAASIFARRQKPAA